ncbi:hypothetical protein T261_08170 [Streptomyces lydicus]|nr:hypothetical protein T261_08170 [Streptomyces lydicus]
MLGPPTRRCATLAAVSRYFAAPRHRTKENVCSEAPYEPPPS